MVNLLGKPSPQKMIELYKTVFANASVHLHVYGKEGSRVGRKMGHITIVGDNLSKILKESATLGEKISL